MKKILLFTAVFIALLFGASWFNQHHLGSRPGLQIPEMRLTNADTSLTLQSMRGRYVLLSLWSSKDAASRELLNKYAAWQSSHKGQTHNTIEFVSVNFDDNPVLFRALIRADSLNPRTQFHVSGKQADSLRRAYHINDVYGTLLINPEGKVLQVNPSTEELAQL